MLGKHAEAVNAENHPPIDTKKLPVCADNPIDVTDDQFRKYGEDLAKAWDEGKITNIRYLIERLASENSRQTLAYGTNLLQCRRQLVIRNNEINRLRDTNA